MFKGFIQLESSLAIPVQALNSARTPTQLDALPAYRAYGPGGLMQGGTGTASLKNSGSVSAASNATPIVVTSTAHGLTTGTVVNISGVGGNTAANGTFIITKLTADTFSLNGSVGNGAYTSGGTWSVAGLYSLTIDATSANGYVSGQTYSVLVSGAISATGWAELSTFTVV